MKRILLAISLILVPLCATAQDPALVRSFESYEDYAAFMDTHVMARDFIPIVKRLDSSVAHTQADLERIQAQMTRAVPFELTQTALAKRVELLHGFAQEMRVYWGDRHNYFYVYTFLHYIDDRVVVLRFDLNTDSTEIFTRF